MEKIKDFILCPKCFQVFYDKDMFTYHFQSNHAFPLVTKKEYNFKRVCSFGWGVVPADTKYTH